MSLKQELLNKVPLHLKDEPHFHALLDHIKQQDIETKEHLAKFLEQQTGVVEKWLEENKNSGATAVKSVREKIVQLDVLQKCHELTQEFLF